MIELINEKEKFNFQNYDPLNKEFVPLSIAANINEILKK